MGEAVAGRQGNLGGMDQVTIDDTRCRIGLPAGAGPHPAVVVIHEAFGLNADTLAIGQRFVDAGYAVLVPALFSKGFKPLCIARTVVDVFTKDSSASAARIEGLRTWLAARGDVMGDRIGVIGFCMGGSIAVMSAATGDFAAASVNYGLVPKDTFKLSAICPVVGSYGANDTRFLPDAGRLERTLTELGVPHDVEVYDGAGHSFLNQSLPHFISKRTATVGYAPEQAEHAFARIFAFFDTHLRAA